MLSQFSPVQLCHPATRFLCPRGFSRQESWSGWPCPPPGDLLNPGIKPVSLMSSALAGRCFFVCLFVCFLPLPPLKKKKNPADLSKPYIYPLTSLHSMQLFFFLICTYSLHFSPSFLNPQPKLSSLSHYSETPLIRVSNNWNVKVSLKMLFEHKNMKQRYLEALFPLTRLDLPLPLSLSPLVAPISGTPTCLCAALPPRNTFMS